VCRKTAKSVKPYRRWPMTPTPMEMNASEAPSGQCVGSPGADPMLRVLLVTARYPPLLGGTEIHTREIARRLPVFGIAPTVLTTRFDGDSAESIDDVGVPVIRVRAWPPNTDYYFAPKVVSQVLRKRWDIIHIQGIHTAVAPVALGTAAGSSVPYVITLHSGGHSSALRRALRPWWWRMLRPVVVRSDGLIAVSDFEADWFAQLWGLARSRFEVIPSGVTLPAPPGTAPPVDLGLVVSLGRLERYKGHERILRAFPVVLQDIPRARLVLLGTGPEEGRLRRLIDFLGLRDRVTIQSFPADERQSLASLVQRAAVVVSLSQYESQGIAAMEAVALGRPVIVSASTALAALVDRGLARPVHPAAGIDDIAAAVVAELRDPRKPPAAEFPTWNQTTARLADLYTRIGAGTRNCVG
jgi:glycosyltransferase involved in cell wall biosynthesis